VKKDSLVFIITDKGIKRKNKDKRLKYYK